MTCYPTSSRNRLLHASRLSTIARLYGVATVLVSFTCGAQLTNIANAPLVSSSNTTILPNIMLIVDDTPTMSREFMPDEAHNVFDSPHYGYVAAQCNGLFYDPNTTYYAPVDSTGAGYPNAQFNNAWVDGYNTNKGTVDLSTNFAIASYAPAAAYYYTYKGTQTTAQLKNYVDTTSLFYRECASTIGSAPGGGMMGVFTKVTVSTSSGPGGTDETGNFANWYSYYRTRMLMMKTAAGFAFQNIDDKYRVGYITTNNANGLLNKTPDFLNWAPFDSSQKKAFYNILYTAEVLPSGYTTNNAIPSGLNGMALSNSRQRMTLSQVGQMYAGKLKNIYNVNVNDPVEYSCQKNFTIMATDGGWADSPGKKLDGTTDVGQQDDVEPRPYFDGSGTMVTKTTQADTVTQPKIDVLDVDVIQQQDKLVSDSQRTSQIWTRVMSTPGFINTCNVGAPVTCLQDNGANPTGTPRVWCPASNNTQGSNCKVHPLNASIYVCRDLPPPVAPATLNPCISTGVLSYCIMSSNVNVNCMQVYAGNSLYLCPISTKAGTIVTDDTQSYTRTIDQLTPKNNDRYDITTPEKWTYTYTETRIDTTTTIGTLSSTSSVVTGISPNPPIPSKASRGMTTSAFNQTLPLPLGFSQDSGDPTVTPTPPGVKWLSQSISQRCVANASAPPQNTTTMTQSPTQGATTMSTATVTTTTNYGSPTYSVVAPAGASLLGAFTSSPPNYPTKSFVNNGSATTMQGMQNTVTVPQYNGIGDTLADVAIYYYKTDLRDPSLSNNIGALGTDVSPNNVPPGGSDVVPWQHMTTFTLGLGVTGRMVYSPTYPTDQSGDFHSIANQVISNSATGICSWQTPGEICNWPTPDPLGNLPNITVYPSTMRQIVAGQLATVDDLWHAAVNGRGTYVAATDPTSLGNAMRGALANIASRVGASAAAVSSNPNVVSGDNFQFASTFVSQEWVGQVERYTIDLTTGASNSTPDWQAQAQIDNSTYPDDPAPSLRVRTLYTRSAGSGNPLKPFKWSQLSAAEQAYFTRPYISTLSQFCMVGASCLSNGKQKAAEGQPLVNYLGGDRSNEGVAPHQPFRVRTHLLGDVVNAEAAYVRIPLNSYSDVGFSTFQTSMASRQGMVYVAANDGMLHAFDSTTGLEKWAYIPSFVLPNLYQLADENYSNQHQYLLDGTPATESVYIGGQWRTILVGGQGAGGRNYYALDVTNPTSPVSLWEFTDVNMGLTFGNPVITKLKDGTWVVIVTSGYNNVSPGDGVGRLYILDAGSGKLLQTISTGVGNTTTPSGLSRIVGFATQPKVDNTSLRVYGGDQLGNIWRFDINGDINVVPYSAQLLVTLTDASGTPQPITAKMEIGTINGVDVVFAITGQLLGLTDFKTSQQQTVYAIKDVLSPGSSPGTPIYKASPRNLKSTFVQQTVVQGSCPSTAPPSVCSPGQIVFTGSTNAVNFAQDDGWYIDLPLTGERGNTDLTLQLGTLAFTTNIPSFSNCAAGGFSQSYALDYRNGQAISTAGGVLGKRLANALATRPVLVSLPSGAVIALVTLADGTKVSVPVPVTPGLASLRRVSWREVGD